MCFHVISTRMCFYSRCTILERSKIRLDARGPASCRTAGYTTACTTGCTACLEARCPGLAAQLAARRDAWLAVQLALQPAARVGPKGKKQSWSHQVYPQRQRSASERKRTPPELRCDNRTSLPRSHLQSCGRS